MAIPIFILGIGTGVGKTLASAIIAEALEADYWKPIQAGFEDGTDREWVAERLSNPTSIVHPELYKLKMPASPHIAAREENVQIDLESIVNHYHALPTYNRFVVVEGAGGLMVPISENDFVIDIAQRLHAQVVLVSRNYLGSINHSLMTASLCKNRKLQVAGWLFNDNYLHYENEIVNWSGYPTIGSIPLSGDLNKEFIKEQAAKIAPRLKELLQ